jgi:exosortase
VEGGMSDAAPIETRDESLAAEAKRCWDAVPDKALFLGLLAAWAVLFHAFGNSTLGYVGTPSIFAWLINAYNSPSSEDGHGNLMPFVVLGLFWWRRDELLAMPKRVWPPALALLAVAVLLHVGGYVVQQPRISVVALFVGIYALMGLAWGPAWLRASFFPFVLFVFCVPIGSLAEGITFPLRMLVAKVTAAISNGVLGIAVVRDGSQIFSPARTFNYDVAPACSGIRSLISLLALTTIYGFVTFRATWRRAFMVLVAVPLAVLGNVVRLVGVIVVAEAFGQNAGAFVEQRLGFVTFVVAIGCVLGLGVLLREKPVERDAEKISEGGGA